MHETQYKVKKTDKQIPKKKI